METRNTIESSYHSKVRSTQDKGVLFSCCLGLHVWVIHNFFQTWQLTILADVQLLHKYKIWCISSCFILLYKLFHLQQSQGISNSPWCNNSYYVYWGYVNAVSIHLIRKKFPSFQINYYLPTRKTRRKVMLS